MAAKRGGSKPAAAKKKAAGLHAGGKKEGKGKPRATKVSCTVADIDIDKPGFSEECQVELAAEGYEPGWFGTYEAVRELIHDAKESVEIAKKKHKPPDPRDVYLSHCQSGHMVQNAVFQLERDDPCSNVPPGCYEMGLAPCMPQWGQATQKGGEHYVVTRHEAGSAHAASGGKAFPGLVDADGNPVTMYSGEIVDQHADRRLVTLLDAKGRDDLLPDIVPADKLAEARATTREAQAERDAASDAIGAVAPTEDGPVKGESAAECINNFRKAGMKAMRQKIIKERGANEAKHKANSKGGKDSVINRAKKALKDAEDALDKTPEEQKAKRKELSKAVDRARNARIRATSPGCLAKQAKELEDAVRAGKDLGATPDGVIPRNVKQEKMDFSSTTSKKRSK